MDWNLLTLHIPLFYPLLPSAFSIDLCDLDCTYFIALRLRYSIAFLCKLGLVAYELLEIVLVEQGYVDNSRTGKICVETVPIHPIKATSLIHAPTGGYLSLKAPELPPLLSALVLSFANAGVYIAAAPHTASVVEHHHSIQQDWPDSLSRDPLARSGSRGCTGDA